MCISDTSPLNTGRVFPSTNKMDTCPFGSLRASSLDWLHKFLLRQKSPRFVCFIILSLPRTFLFLFSFLFSLFSFVFSRFFWLRVPFLPAQGLVGPGRPDFDLYLRGLSSERFNASFLPFIFLEIVIKNTKFETKFIFFYF